MRIAYLTIAAGALALFAGLITLAPEAEARRIGRVHVRPHINGHNIHVRPRRVVRRNVRRAGRWVNGVWVVGGVASSVAVGTASNCGYYWRKWNETRSAYWHERYVENCR
jgi:hypothetical protein